jgi:hypothetical protein
MDTTVKIIGKIDLNNTTTIKDVVLETRVKGMRMHRFTVPWMISEDQARELQADLSYHPAGYGFYRFESSPKETVWYCGDSCD